MTSNKTETVTISAPKLETASFLILGTAPYVQHKFGAKARRQMMEKQAAGSQAKKGKQRDPKDFDDVFQQAQHLTRDGRNGIPAPAFRSAMIDACRLIGFKMTHAKISVFIEADDFDADDGTPMVYINGDIERHEGCVRNETGVADVRVRPMWRKWSAVVRVTYDADVFSHTDIANLLTRAGAQVGVGEGRPFSKQSHGMGWGTFRIANADEVKEAA